MVHLIKSILEKERFNPGFLSFFINPYLIIRRGLYKGIRLNSHYLSGKLLDFGCGSKPYANLFDVTEYIGLDIKESGNHKKHKTADVYYDGHTLPFEDNTFDSIFTSEVFEHIFNLDAILEELHRILKVEGKILITVPFVWDEHEVPYDYGRYSSYGIKYILEKHNFKIMELHKSSNFILSIFQLSNSYIFQQLSRFKPLLVLLPIILFISHSFAFVTAFILPKNNDLYLNNIVIAQKNLSPMVKFKS